VFTSPSELDAHLQNGDKHDIFVYKGPDREVVLRNDCRSYPLRIQATFEEEVSEHVLTAFVGHCREAFEVSFRSSIPGSRKSRLPGIASKVGVYAPLDTIEVHFYKDACREDRRRVIGWLVQAS
jgi:hypothetical protein